MNIAIPVIIVVAIGLVASVILVIASKVFYVYVDETTLALRAAMPGANCGGCGYAGCDDYANALGADHTLSPTKCPVGGADLAAKLAEILGVSAEMGEKQVAVVMCNGTSEAVKSLMEYDDIKTCKAAKTLYGGMNLCPYGCLGQGDCVVSCDFDALKIVDGVAVVDREKCTSCGACVKACPNHLIRISPAKNLVFVRCNNTDKGADARKACANACIGCMKCVKVCKFDSIKVENNVAYIDPDKCKNCGLCARECPTGAIVNLRMLGKKAPAKKPAAKPAPKADAPAKEAAPKAEAPAKEAAPKAEAPAKESAPKAEAPVKEAEAKAEAAVKEAPAAAVEKVEAKAEEVKAEVKEAVQEAKE